MLTSWGRDMSIICSYRTSHIDYHRDLVRTLNWFRQSGSLLDSLSTMKYFGVTIKPSDCSVYVTCPCGISGGGDCGSTVINTLFNPANAD